MRARYPTLRLIDQVLRAGQWPFSSDPAAAELEREAERLVGAYCSDTVWLTGDIAAAPLMTIRDALEHARCRALPISLLVSDPEQAPATPPVPAV
jgi:hypothetical protein